MKQIQMFAVSLAILGVGLPATADVKAFHGAVCQPEYPFDRDRMHYDVVDGLVGDAVVSIVCPLIRDRINSSTSLQSVYVELQNNNSGSISCTLYAQDEDPAGSFVDYDSELTYATGDVQLGFEVTSSNGNEGSYALHCTLGEDDQINHIHTNEDGGASD